MKFYENCLLLNDLNVKLTNKMHSKTTENFKLKVEFLLKKGTNEIVNNLSRILEDTKMIELQDLFLAQKELTAYRNFFFVLAENGPVSYGQLKLKYELIAKRLYAHELKKISTTSVCKYLGIKRVKPKHLFYF